MTDATGGHEPGRDPLHVEERAAGGYAGSARIVFVHGSMDTSDSFQAVIDLLPDVNAIRYDRRGYGCSRIPGAPGSPLSGHVDDLLAVVGDRPSIVVGHSLGASISLAAAARAPEVITAVLAYEPPMPWARWWPSFALPRVRDPPEALLRAAAEQFMCRAIGAERWDRLTPAQKESFLASAAAWEAELRTARTAQPPPFEPSAVPIDVLVAYGTATDDRHQRAARLIAEQAPRATLAGITGADHVAHRRRPADFAALVRRVVADVGHGSVPTVGRTDPCEPAGPATALSTKEREENRWAGTAATRYG